MAAWNPDGVRETLAILKGAGIVRDWGETADGDFSYLWNDQYRDGLGGEKALKILHDILLACGGIPFVGARHIRVMMDLGAVLEKPDDPSAQ